MVQFSKRLTSRGVKVTLITIDYVSKNMPKESDSVKIESIPHDESPPQDVDKALEWFFALISKNLGAIVEKLSDSECPVKVLVFYSIVTWAIDLAHKLGLKRAAFITQSCSLSAIYYHMDPEKNQNINFKKADWLFFNTFDVLEKEVVDWLRVQYPIKTIGPTIPSMYLDERLKEDKEYGLSLLNPNGETCMNFTHCGWNSTLEALCLGVPMVAMPQWSDQPINAKFISDVWQTGIRIKAGEDGVVNRDEIASSIREVTVEENGVMFKDNAIKLKQSAKEAVDEGGSSDKNIEEFFQTCKALINSVVSCAMFVVLVVAPRAMFTALSREEEEDKAGVELALDRPNLVALV
ncbi:hypothetical protein RND71_004880 [Anisodus tanguticus]|uniref:Uncharacterized protein n=1 Tax=Anisodus tanguticus TaxID=243964 RepID=A0AAE1SMX1_9SOLA|nr:hypothetical protein RND71_004880 [Anisodus tanguticus]